MSDRGGGPDGPIDHPKIYPKTVGKIRHAPDADRNVIAQNGVTVASNTNESDFITAVMADESTTLNFHVHDPLSIAAEIGPVPILGTRANP